MKNIKMSELVAYDAVRNGELEIDADGNIWRIAIRRWNRWKGEFITTPCERHRAEHDTGAYLQVGLRMSKKKVNANAHRLVFMHFNGEVPEGMTINHKNGNKKDNRPENLEAVTYSENVKHAYRTGLKEQNGEKNPNAKLTNTQVEEIRKIYATREKTQMELSKIYGVSFQSISKIVRGDRRKNQEGETADYVHMRQRTKLQRNKKGQYRSA